MNSVIQILLDWSEVWAPLIPITVFVLRRGQPVFMRPVIAYLVIGLLINIVCDVIGDFKSHLPSWMQSNNPLYNVHSIIRFIFFSLFFILLKQQYFIKLKYILPLIAVVIIGGNFLFEEDFSNPDHLSGNLLSTEAYILLIYCMLYYLSKLRDEVDDIASGPDFWVVTGLSIYVVVNFFVFLFYVPMINQDGNLADNMWTVHNIAYIILCVFLTKAFYESARYQYTV